jgi:hypothetical protein
VECRLGGGCCHRTLMNFGSLTAFYFTEKIGFIEIQFACEITEHLAKNVAPKPTLQEVAASELYSSNFDRKSCSHYEADDRQVNSESLK